MDIPDDRAVVLAVDGPITPDDVPDLWRRALELLSRPGVSGVVCDVGALVAPDADTLDALARLQLAALRTGRRVTLRHAPPALLDLLALAGLTQVVPQEDGELS